MFEFYCIFYALHRPHFATFCFFYFIFLYFLSFLRESLSRISMSAGYIKFRKLYAKSGPPTLNSALALLNTNIFLVEDNCLAAPGVLRLCFCACGSLS